MFDTIIVPLDGSSIAEVALSYAEEMAVRLGSELVLLFIRDPEDSHSINLVECYLRDKAQEVKDSVASYLKDHGNEELKIQIKVLTGNPADEIINFAEDIPNSHIIMATHGQSCVGLRWSLGSVAAKVVHGTSVPVGLIRAEKDRPAVRRPLHLTRILAPLDGSEQSKVSLPFVREMAIRLKLEVRFLQVIMLNFSSHFALSIQEISNIKSKISDELGEINEQFKESGIQASYDVIETDKGVSETIDEYAKMHGVDLVIMATHGRSGMSRLVMGSVASKMARHGSVPVLLIGNP